MTDIQKFQTLMTEFGIEMCVTQHEPSARLNPCRGVKCSEIHIKDSTRDGYSVEIDNGEGIPMCSVFVFDEHGHFIGSGATDFIPTEWLERLLTNGV